MPLIALLACGAPAGDPDDACAWQFADDEHDPDARTIGTRVPDGDDVVGVRIRWPAAPAEDARRSIAVVAHGGWEDEGAFIDDLVPLDVADGLTSIHLDLPGAGASTGTSDRRGPSARSAVAAALRYAAGEEIDLDGCTIDARVPGADVGDVHLVGLSNGGNLAAATLADASLDLPDVRGLVTWETPAGAPFATVAHGNDPTVYTPGACALGDAGVACDYPLDELLSAGGDVCFDLDADGACGEADVNERGVVDPESELRMIDPTLVAALGTPPPSFADAEAAAAWWADRDATQAAGALVAAWPDLPVMIVGTAEDHVLTYPDHPHVFALGEALQRAGVAWIRLNPGAEWLPANDVENEPNAPFSMASPDLALLPEDAEGPLGTALAAAVAELSDRGR